MNIAAIYTESVLMEAVPAIQSFSLNKFLTSKIEDMFLSKIEKACFTLQGIIQNVPDATTLQAKESLTALEALLPAINFVKDGLPKAQDTTNVNFEFLKLANKFISLTETLILALHEQSIPDFFVHVSYASDNVWNNPADERWDRA
jgi:hypothetical protein